MILRIATRKSPLALAQTRWVAGQLQQAHPQLRVEEVHVVTQGDRILDKPLAKIGGKGLFISEVEATIARGEAELAVHSMKDIPDEIGKNMALSCVPKREDPRDLLVSPRGWRVEDVPTNSTIGTSSLRRATQLSAARPDLRFKVIRGNVGTRLDKLTRGEYDAIVLAYAGLRRIQLDKSTPFTILNANLSIPAVGQGALGLETRADDSTTRALLECLEDSETRLAAEAERALLRRLEGGCSTPLAGYAERNGDEFRLHAMVASIDGETILRADAKARLRTITDAHQLGYSVADVLLSKGAKALITASKHVDDPYATPLYRES